MDKGRQATATVGANSNGTGGILSAGVRPGRGPRRAKLRLTGLIVGLVVVLAAIVVGVYALHKSPVKKPATAASTTTSKLPGYFSTLNLQEQVDYYLARNNYTAAIGLYNNELKTAKTADARAQADMGICGVYTTKQDYPSAYQYALKAYGIEATEQTATTAGGAAANAGDKTAAAKYYQAAITLLPKENLPSDQYVYDLRVLQAELQGASQ